MKFYLIIHEMTDSQAKVKAAWDAYSQSNGLMPRPTGAGPNKYTVVTNARPKKAKRWNPPRR